MNEGWESVDDDEIVYRRLPIKPEFYNPAISENPTPIAFRPREADSTGLSVFRAKFVSAEQVAKNPENRSYYVISFRVGDLRANGIEVVSRPVPEKPGHAEITSLTFQNRKTDSAREVQQLLAQKLWLRIEGPYT